jgi:hypothetical protein
VSGSRVTSQSVRYRERLRVPWWWWPLGVVPAAVFGYEINLGFRGLPGWLSFAVLSAVTVAVLLWLGRFQVWVTDDGDDVELWAGDAHVPLSAVARTAEVPHSAKSAALGRQLDPAAYVLHRGWVGPMVLLVLDDPHDPTPYWLVSCRRPGRVLAAFRG